MGWIAAMASTVPGPPATKGDAQQINQHAFLSAEATRLAKQGKLREMISLVREHIEQGLLENPSGFLKEAGMDAFRSGCISALEMRRLPHVLEFCETVTYMGIRARDCLGKQGARMVLAECNMLLKEKRLEECFRSLKALSECGFRVKDLVDSRAFMEACAELHNVELGLRYVDLLPSENPLKPYNMLMQKFRDQLDLPSVVDIFRSLGPAGLSPSLYSYSILLDTCGRCGEVAKAGEIFERLFSSGEPLNAVIYNTMMNAVAGNSEHVDKLWRLMLSTGITPSLVTFNIMLKSYKLSRDPISAYRLFKRLQEQGIPLCPTSYSTLFQIFGEAKMPSMVFKLKDDMQAAKMKLNAINWACLIEACISSTFPDKALQVFQEMVESGCAPTEYVYNLLLKACLEGGQIQRVHTLFEEWKRTGKILPPGTLPAAELEFVPLNIMAFNIVMKACESPDDVERLMEEMVKFGFTPDAISWVNLISVYGYVRNLDGAIQAFKRMQQAGIQPSVMLYTALIQACMRVEDVTLALSYFEEMKRAGIAANEMTYATLMRAKRPRDTAKFLSIYEEMRTNGFPPLRRHLKHLIEEWAEQVINAGTNIQPHAAMFHEYGKSVLNKVTVGREAGTLTIDLRGRVKEEARASLLIILRMIKDQYTQERKRIAVEEDLIIMTEPPREDRVKSYDVVLQVLETQLGISCEQIQTDLRKPVAASFASIRVSKEALDDWIHKRHKNNVT